MNYLTTGDCCRITGLSQQTIIRAIDKGLLKGFKVPGSKHRRVTTEALKEFMVTNNIPLTKLEQEGRIYNYLKSNKLRKGRT
jgi:two-component system, OmpR family, response regulator RpaA